MQQLLNRPDRRYLARFALTAAELKSAQQLRGECFYPFAGFDSDDFDARCQHVLVEDADSGAVLGCFRLMLFARAADITDSYAAQFYDLNPLADYQGALLEVGRFCLRPGVDDPDILRVAWGFLTRYVDDNSVKMLFGCSSFQGNDPQCYQQALALLQKRYLGVAPLMPGRRAPEIYEFTAPDEGFDLRKAMLEMPPLLRSYLAMGGFVSDHGVIDRQLKTLHVFTGLEIRAIPAARLRALRALSKQG